MAKDLRRFPVGTGGVRPGLFAGLALLCAEREKLSAKARGDFFVCGEGDAREEVGPAIDLAWEHPLIAQAAIEAGTVSELPLIVRSIVHG